MTTCPCGSGLSYDDCCSRWHKGDAAPNAEVLMRSRYCAYVLKLEAYLLTTWHPSTRPEALHLDDVVSQKWLGLSVKQHSVISIDKAAVEFVATYKIGGGKAERLHEISRFVLEDGKWLYMDGEFLS